MSKAKLLRTTAALPTPAATPLEPDQHVPDPQVCAELGITSMTLWRYDHDADLNFPPAIKIRTRNFRSRRLLEEWKARMLRRAVEQRAAGGAA